MKRLNATTDVEFFQQFVQRYPDKQYQTWLGSGFVKVGIDYDYEEELKNKVFAGLASHFLDYSFASALKLARGIDNTDNLPKFEQKFDTVESVFYLTSFDFLQAHRPITIADKHLPIQHAELFLLRTLTSLRASRSLINWGYFSEPLTILRSALEQISWAYAVGVIFNEQQLNRPNPSKCIGIFQKRFAPAGRLYGSLSRFSHMDFEAQRHFVATSGDRAGVIQQSTEFKFFGMLFSALIMISFQIVCRDLREIYNKEYGVNYRIRNSTLPLRSLLNYALARPEIRNDYVANELREILFSAS